MANTSLQGRYNRYVQGGLTKLEGNKLGFWQRNIFPADDSDIKVVLDSQYHNRPWLLAYDIYKDVKLTWFILQYNTILDVDVEFVTGATIYLPTPYRLKIGLMSSVNQDGI